jgi:hypothetical protein
MLLFMDDKILMQDNHKLQHSISSLHSTGKTNNLKILTNKWKVMLFKDKFLVRTKNNY